MLVSQAVNDISLHYSENPKFREQTSESLTLAQIGVAARSPVCHIYNLSPFFWALSTQNRGHSVHSRAYICFADRQIMLAHACDFSTLVQVTEPGSVHARVYCLSHTRCSPVLFSFVASRRGVKISWWLKPVSLFRSYDIARTQNFKVKRSEFLTLVQVAGATSV